MTEREVAKMISNLKNSSAYGHDEIDPIFVKFGLKFLLSPINHVVNTSIVTGIFPSRWKLARVIPLLKSKELDKQSPSSYRPVSQLPLVSKLTERALQVQLLEFLETTGQLAVNNHAYRRQLGTTTAILQI